MVTILFPLNRKVHFLFNILETKRKKTCDETSKNLVKKIVAISLLSQFECVMSGANANIKSRRDLVIHQNLLYFLISIKLSSSYCLPSY